MKYITLHKEVSHLFHMLTLYIIIDMNLYLTPCMIIFWKKDTKWCESEFYQKVSMYLPDKNVKICFFSMFIFKK